MKEDNCYSSPLHRLQSLFSQKQDSSSRMMYIFLSFCCVSVTSDDLTSVIIFKFFSRLIIADEMDFLITKDRGVLHDLFMLTIFPFSTCILIGTVF